MSLDKVNLKRKYSIVIAIVLLICTCIFYINYLLNDGCVYEVNVLNDSYAGTYEYHCFTWKSDRDLFISELNISQNQNTYNVVNVNYTLS